MDTPPDRKYAVFISYRHADNKEQGRQWATWLHHTLETYEIPPDLIGRTNLRGESVPASLYPVFRDEEELPADADLSANIQRALRHSALLVVLCSPRAVESRFVADEIRFFKELGKAGHILALMIDGEPNATDDPGKARIDIRPEHECLPKPLRYGVPREDGSIDWTKRTEPIAADMRPGNKPVQGWTTAAAYREELNRQGLAKPKIDRLTTAYEEQLQLAIMKIIAGAIGLPLGEVTQRDKVHQLEKQKQKAKTLRHWLAAVIVLAVTSLVGGVIAYKQKQAADAQTKLAIESEGHAKLQKQTAEAQTLRAINAEKATQAQLIETNRQLERSQLEEGKAWIERARAALGKGDLLSAIMLAGRAAGYCGYGRESAKSVDFDLQFPSLLGSPMTNSESELERQKEAKNVTQFIESIRPTNLPLWAADSAVSVTCVAFSPDSTHLAACFDDGTIKLWDAVSGKTMASFVAHSGAVTAIAFTPESTQLVSGSEDQTVKLWDVASGKQVAVLAGHGSGITCVAVSPDGTYIASGSSDKTIKIWNTQSRKAIMSLNGHTNRVCSLSFSPDGSTLASGSLFDVIKIWDIGTRSEIASLQGETEPGYSNEVNSIAFNRDGTRLASGSGFFSNGKAKIWDMVSRKEIAVLSGQSGPIRTVAFSPDGETVATGSGHFLSLRESTVYSYTGINTIKFWNVATGKATSVLDCGREMIMSVAFSLDGSRLASGSLITQGNGGITRLWDVERGATDNLKGHESLLNSFQFSAQGTLVATASDDKTIKLWDADTSIELITLKGHSDGVASITFSPSGRFLASGGSDNFVKLWDISTGAVLCDFLGHAEGVWSLAFSADGKQVASGSLDGTIVIWDASTRSKIGSVKSQLPLGVVSVTYSPDGQYLVGCSPRAKKLNSSVGRSSSLVGPDFANPDRGFYMLKTWRLENGNELIESDAIDSETAWQWLADSDHSMIPDGTVTAERQSNNLQLFRADGAVPDLAACFSNKLLAWQGRDLIFPLFEEAKPMLHIRHDTLAQLADPNLTPERRAELRMQLCTKSRQFRAATALWQRLLQGEWPGFEGAPVSNEQAPATIPADSPIRRLYLLALIDATKHPQIHGHPTSCQTTAQIAPVLTKEMMAMPTISLAMMSLMRTLAKDDSPDMITPRADLLKHLEEVAAKEWLEVMRQSTAK